MWRLLSSVDLDFCTTKICSLREVVEGSDLRVQRQCHGAGSIQLRPHVHVGCKAAAPVTSMGS